METTLLTCPRCLRPLPDDSTARFCPRCGLADAHTSAGDTSPIDVTSGGRTYRVLDRLAVGSVSVLYRCQFESGGQTVKSIFKVAREPQCNALLANEAAVLRVFGVDPHRQFAPFLPAVEDSFEMTGESPPRRANVLRYDAEITSPDDLYTLEDVRQAYPGGVDPRDAAWMWRRLLNVLAFAHARGVVHRAVLPPHVLIEPGGHRLVLIDWCCARYRDDPTAGLITGGFRDWYRRSGASRDPTSAALDVALATRSFIELLGGDPVRAQPPSTLDPALQRYFGRCLGADGSGSSAGAAKLLEDFDRLIDALWGPRAFRAFALPPKRPGA